jgi:hypothetical protein
MYYYAFRYDTETNMHSGTAPIDRKHGETLPVRNIMKDTNVWLGGWLDERSEGGANVYFSGITEDEYNMLDAFGVEVISAETIRSHNYVFAKS